MSKKKNKETIVRDISTIACALLGIILVRLMLMGKK